MGEKFLLGHKWVTSGGSMACQRCAAMNGREFYIDPKPGQLRYPDDVAQAPPLHPNCRCKLEPITDYRQVVADSINAGPPPDWYNPYLHGDGVKFGGGYWGNDGRNIADGPANWNYCGRNWTAGRNPNNVKPGENPAPHPEPANDLDACCKRHDELYEWAARSSNPREARDQGDRILIDEAQSLPHDPRH